MSSLEDLVHKTVPSAIRFPDFKLSNNEFKSSASLDGPRGEQETLAEFKEMMSQNKVFRSHIGLGYYDTVVPPVILRNILENPGWYTPYTPYQAEIAQGRLEMLLNFQTMVSDLTGLGTSSASLLDEGTAAAEAMNMLFGGSSKNVILVDSNLFPQTIDVVRTRALGFGIKVETAPLSSPQFDYKALFEKRSDEAFAVMLQYPGADGFLPNIKPIVDAAKASKLKVACASDLLALTLLTPPGTVFLFSGFFCSFLRSVRFPASSVG